MKTKQIKFKKGIKTIHIPFSAEIGSYDQLNKEIQKYTYPKTARRIEASLVVSIDLKKGATSYQMAEVVISK